MHFLFLNLLKKKLNVEKNWKIGQREEVEDEVDGLSVEVLKFQVQSFLYWKLKTLMDLITRRASAKAFRPFEFVCLFVFLGFFWWSCLLGSIIYSYSERAQIVAEESGPSDSDGAHFDFSFNGGGRVFLVWLD